MATKGHEGSRRGAYGFLIHERSRRRANGILIHEGPRRAAKKSGERLLTLNRHDESQVALCAFAALREISCRLYRAVSLGFWSLLAFGCGLAVPLILARGAIAQGFTDNPAYHEARGPIPIRNGRAYNQLVLQFAPESADILAPGKSRFGIQFDVFNNLLIPVPRGAAVEEDYEEQRLLLSLRKGLGRGTEFAIYVPIRYRNGGFIDEMLSVWHRFWGIESRTRDDPAGRGSGADYRSRIRLTDALGMTRVDVGNAFGAGDVTATIKRALIRQTPRSALSARLGLKAPTGNPGLLLGSGSVDAGITLDGRYSVGRRIVLFANLGGVMSGGATRVPGVRRWVNEYMLATELRANNRDSYLFQLDGNSVVVRTGNARADESQATFTVGYQRVLDRRLVFYSSFSENGDWNGYSTSFFGGVGPDFTVTLGLVWR